MRPGPCKATAHTAFPDALHAGHVGKAFPGIPDPARRIQVEADAQPLRLSGGWLGLVRRYCFWRCLGLSVPEDPRPSCAVVGGDLLGFGCWAREEFLAVCGVCSELAIDWTVAFG